MKISIIVLVDDGSTDDTPAILALYAPGKCLFRRSLMPCIYPNLNRNKN